MRTLLQDLHYGIRMLAKTPSVAVLIILTLSLGIGGSTLFFNMVRQWVVNPVTFPRADGLSIFCRKSTGRKAGRAKLRRRTLLTGDSRTPFSKAFPPGPPRISISLEKIARKEFWAPA